MKGKISQKKTYPMQAFIKNKQKKKVIQMFFEIPKFLSWRFNNPTAYDIVVPRLQ